MVSRQYRACRLRVPGWLIVLAALLTASVIAERAKAGTVSPEGRLAHYPRTSQLVSGRGIAFALTFDQIVSHTGSQVTLVTPTGSTRNIAIRLVAQPNTLYAAVGGLAPGSYVLQWKAQGAVGTILSGSLPFSVGQGRQL